MTILHHGALRVNSHDGLFGHPITIRGRISGFFMERTREYYRKIQGSKHFLRKPLAITNDVDALAEAERLGADRVRIVDSETGIEYTCIITVIRDYGFPVNRNYGEQIGLPLGYWIKTAPDGTVTPPTLPKQPQPQPAAMTDQPMLFDMPAGRKAAY